MQTADPKVGGSIDASSDDATVVVCYVRVGGGRFIDLEVQITLDGKSDLAAYGERLVLPIDGSALWGVD